MSGTSATDREVTAAGGYELVLAQERFVVDVQTTIHRLLQSRGLKQSDLANLLGVSPARVSQMFGDEARNLTLRTLAKIYHVLGTRCRLVEDTSSAVCSDENQRGDLVSPQTEALNRLNDVEAGDAGWDEVQEVDNRAERLSAWLEELDASAMLSDKAALMKRAVWIFDSGPVVAANENHAVSGGRGRSYDAERWAQADSLYAYG